MECVSALYLLYKFRNFERQMGSSKFVSFVVVVTLMAISIQLGLLLSMPIVQRVAPGPLALVFALFVLYYGQLVTAVRGVSEGVGAGQGQGLGRVASGGVTSAGARATQALHGQVRVRYSPLCRSQPTPHPRVWGGVPNADAASCSLFLCPPWPFCCGWLHHCQPGSPRWTFEPCGCAA